MSKLEIYYCKSLKKTGRPIIVRDVAKKAEMNTNEFEMHNVNIRIAFKNAKGKAKASGATTILEVWKDK